MKKILALSLALVMVVGLLPTAVMTVSAETTYQSFSGADLANDVTVSADGHTATITDTDTARGTNQIYLYNVFKDMTNPHLTQTIQINNMPVFTGVANSGNAHQSSGYFNVMEGPRTKPDGVNYNEPYVRYSIFRADDAGNLKLTIFKNNFDNATGAAVTEENSYTVDLNKKLGDEFTLTTLWNDHDTVSFYCGGSLLGTYEDVTFNRGNYAGLDALFFGYLPHLANTTDYAATTEIIVKNMIIADGHTPGADDGNCLTAVKCSCGAVATEAAAAHVETTLPNGNVVCYTCGTLIREAAPAESTPAESTPAESTPAESTPAESTPAESTPAESTPAESTPATSAPAATTPAASTPAATTPSNPETGSASNAMYVALLTISMLAIAALMIPEVRNKLIRK